MKESLVYFKDVVKSYDGTTIVVRKLNLSINEGEFVTLLGPSGSGKTTCLMMLAGFESVTEGDIFIDGKTINRIPPNKRNLGMVFQDYALFPHMTVGENLAFPLEVRKKSKNEIKEAIQNALSIVSLTGFENRRISQLSGGQKQRVAVSRALIFNPKIILMDEPLGALDKNLREELQIELKHLHESLGSTFIYVTHDQGEALTMSDRIAVFSDGVIQQYATPQDLWESPQNSFVASFIGENNQLPATVESVRNGICIARLSSNGALVKAKAVKVSKKGQKTLLSVRPECIEVDMKRSTKDSSRVKGKIKEIIYMGDHRKMRLDVEGNDKFIIRVSRKQIHRQLNVGDAVFVGWQAADCNALDAA